MRKHTVKQSLAAGLIALGLMAVAACGGGDDDAGRPTTTESTTSESTAPPTTSAEEGVEADYLAAVEAFARVSTTTVDPNDPELPAHYTDTALSSIRTLLSTWQAEGKIWVVGDLSRHTVHAPITFRADHTAVVPGCDVTNDAFVDVGSTEIAFPEPTTSESTTTMVQHDGVWVVQDSQHVRDWQGVSDCTG